MELDGFTRSFFNGGNMEIAITIIVGLLAYCTFKIANESDENEKQ